MRGAASPQTNGRGPVRLQASCSSLRKEVQELGDASCLGLCHPGRVHSDITGMGSKGLHEGDRSYRITQDTRL